MLKDFLKMIFMNFVVLWPRSDKKHVSLTSFKEFVKNKNY